MQAIEPKWMKTGWRIASIFLGAGLLLAADLLLLTAGNWAISALVILLWVLPSPLWVWRRDVAASFYLPVWLALAWFVAVAFRNLFPLMPLKVGLSFFLLQAMLLSAPLMLTVIAVPIVRTLRELRAWRLPALAVCPFLLLASVVLAERLGDVKKTSAHEMSWTSNVDQLAAATGLPLPFLSRPPKSPALPEDEPQVLLYRQVGDGYCIYIVHSGRLLAYLRGHGKPQVRVTYAVRYSFGRYRGDQGVLSIDDYSMDQPGQAYDYGDGSGLVVGNVPVGTDCAR